MNELIKNKHDHNYRAEYKVPNFKLVPNLISLFESISCQYTHKCHHAALDQNKEHRYSI
jgi:hypothetical protein